jgi:alpha-N-arabinofuranosidase
MILNEREYQEALRHCRSVAMTNLSPEVNTRGAIFVHPAGIVLRPT